MISILFYVIQITDEGITILSQNLPVLLALDISNCNIGDSGVKAIIDNLKYLKNLDFEYGHFVRKKSELMDHPIYKAKVCNYY